MHAHHHGHRVREVQWCPDQLSLEHESGLTHYNIPACAPLFSLSPTVGDSPCSTAGAEILVIEMDDVLVAGIASGIVPTFRLGITWAAMLLGGIMLFLALMPSLFYNMAHGYAERAHSGHALT